MLAELERYSTGMTGVSGANIVIQENKNKISAYEHLYGEAVFRRLKSERKINDHKT